MEGIELHCFEIISNVGSAKSHYIEAIRLAKENKIDIAKQEMELGEKEFLKGHKAHSELLTMDVSGNLTLSLLLIHAEDQLMSAENMKIIAFEFIDLYEKYIHNK